jgi:hypothetical protein
MSIFKSGRGGKRPGAGRPRAPEYDPHRVEWRKTGLPVGVWEYVDEYLQGPRSTHSHALEALIADHYLYRPLGPGKARPRGADGRFLKGGGLYESFANRPRRVALKHRRTP